MKWQGCHPYALAIFTSKEEPKYLFLLDDESTPRSRIKSMKNFKDPIMNETRDLAACSSVPQQAMLPHTPLILVYCALSVTGCVPSV